MKLVWIPSFVSADVYIVLYVLPLSALNSQPSGCDCSDSVGAYCCFRVVWFIFSPRHAYVPLILDFEILVILEYESVHSKIRIIILRLNI